MDFNFNGGCSSATYLYRIGRIRSDGRNMYVISLGLFPAARTSEIHHNGVESSTFIFTSPTIGLRNYRCCTFEFVEILKMIFHDFHGSSFPHVIHLTIHYGYCGCDILPFGWPYYPNQRLRLICGWRIKGGINIASSIHHRFLVYPNVRASKKIQNKKCNYVPYRT